MQQMQRRVFELHRPDGGLKMVTVGYSDGVADVIVEEVDPIGGKLAERRQQLTYSGKLGFKVYAFDVEVISRGRFGLAKKTVWRF